MVYILFYYSQGPRIASLNLRTMEHLFHMQCIMSEHPSCCCCCLSSCPLLQWPCPFIILSLFVPLPLHPTPILTVGHKNPFLRLCVLYVAGNRHIVWDFLSSLSILLHQMPSNKQGLFCSAGYDKGVQCMRVLCAFLLAWHSCCPWDSGPRSSIRLSYSIRCLTSE